MNTKICWAGLGLAALLSGCAGSSGGDGSLSIRLNGTIQNLGGTGQASFTPSGQDGAETQLNLFIAGVPIFVTRPVQLQTFVFPGSCANLGAEPAYSLNDSVTTTVVAGSTWQMSKSIPAPLETFRSGSYAVVIRTMPFDRSLDILCGEVR